MLPNQPDGHCCRLRGRRATVIRKGKVAFAIAATWAITVTIVMLLFASAQFGWAVKAPFFCGDDMGYEPRQLLSLRPRRSATSGARAGCKFVSSTLLASTVLSLAARIAIPVIVLNGVSGVASAQDATWDRA